MFAINPLAPTQSKESSLLKQINLLFRKKLTYVCPITCVSKLTIFYVSLITYIGNLNIVLTTTISNCLELYYRYVVQTILHDTVIKIIKHPGERSLKSYSKLLVVNSGNYYLDRLTADVYEGNITYDVFNYINYINYNAIFIFNNVPNHEKMQ